MICRGCEKEKKLIKAHIIPESFFRGLRGGEIAPQIHSTTEGVHPKRSPIGIYDKEILCHECEQKFQELDDYGNHVLIEREADLEPLTRGSKIAGYRIRSINNDKLKLFFLSILWRASISNHYFFSKVALNRLENSLKNLIWNSDPGGPHDFSFVLAKFEGDGIGRTILDPHQERWFGIRYYRFYLYGYVLYIKADSQKTPSKWAKFIPNDDNLFIVSRGTMEKAKELSILFAGVRNSKKL